MCGHWLVEYEKIHNGKIDSVMVEVSELNNMPVNLGLASDRLLCLFLQSAGFFQADLMLIVSAVLKCGVSIWRVEIVRCWYS